MSKNIDEMEQIDAFINGSMSVTEREAFEARLAVDAELKQEYELQLEVVLAIRANGLKRMLKERSASNSVACDADSANVSSENSLRTKNIFIIAAFAAAAAVMLIYNNILTNDVIAFAPMAREVFVVDENVSRGVLFDEIDNNVGLAANYIDSIDYFRADSLLDATFILIDEEEVGLNEKCVTLSILDDPEIRYYREILQYHRYNAQWLNVLICMEQGKYVVVRRKLQKIVDSDSPYRDTAQDILDEM